MRSVPLHTAGGSLSCVPNGKVNITSVRARAEWASLLEGWTSVERSSGRSLRDMSQRCPGHVLDMSVETSSGRNPIDSSQLREVAIHCSWNSFHAWVGRRVQRRRV